MNNGFIEKFKYRANRYFSRMATLNYLKKLIWHLVRYVLLAGLSFMIIYPLFVKFITAIKSNIDMTDPTVIFIPKNPTLNNFRLVFEGINYPLTMINTIGFELVTCLLQLTSCVLVAYGLARFKFRGRGLMSALIMITLVIPPQAILLPLYIRFRFFGITNIFQYTGNLSGLDLTNTIVPFLLLSATAIAFKNGLYIYMLRQYFKNMPLVLEEAAYIDGCGVLKTFYRIMLPGTVPMLVTIFLFAFVWQWNDRFYISALAPNLQTMANKLLMMKFESMDAIQNYIMQGILTNAKTLLLIAPLIVLYIFTQRYFKESIERSGIVG